jgi:hypothetical protein
LPLDAPSTTGEGGLNSTLTATADLPHGGLASGDAIDVEFEFQVITTGRFTFAYNTEDDLVPAPATAPPVTPTTPTGSTGASGSSGSGSPAVPVAPVVSGIVTPTGVINASSPPATAASPATHPATRKKAKTKKKLKKTKPKAKKPKPKRRERRKMERAQRSGRSRQR